MTGYVYRCWLRILMFLGICAVLTIKMFPAVQSAFMHNMYFNGLIAAMVCFAVFRALGVTAVLHLEIQRFHQTLRGGRGSSIKGDRILSPVEHYMGNFTAQTPLQQQLLLNSIETRLQDMREVSRYLTGLLVFMGLLGTFWGLSKTITAIAETISAVNLDTGDVKQTFQSLKSGLQSPLQGMGTAFSSSLFGLLGSLAVGFLDLQNGRIIQRLLNLIEDKTTPLYPLTKAVETAESASMPFLIALLNKTVEGLDKLTRQMQEQEDARITIARNLHTAGERLSQLAEISNINQQTVNRMTHNQEQMQDTIRRNETAASLQAVEHALLQMNKSLMEGRRHLTEDITKEIRNVSKTFTALAKGQDVDVA